MEKDQRKAYSFDKIDHYNLALTVNLIFLYKKT